VLEPLSGIVGKVRYQLGLELGRWRSTAILTFKHSDAALQLLRPRPFFWRTMDQIVETIIKSFDQDVGEFAHEKVRSYIDLLASVGKTEEQLVDLGKAYLVEIRNPDRRYSGC
jgi:hypothetical protein